MRSKKYKVVLIVALALLTVVLLRIFSLGDPRTANGVANRIKGENRWQRDPMIGSPGDRDDIYIWIINWGDGGPMSISVSQNDVDLDNKVVASERLGKDLLGVQQYVYCLRYLCYSGSVSARKKTACYEYKHYSDDPDVQYAEETKAYEFQQKFFPRDVAGVDYTMPHLTYQDVVDRILEG